MKTGFIVFVGDDIAHIMTFESELPPEEEKMVFDHLFEEFKGSSKVSIRTLTESEIKAYEEQCLALAEAEQKEVKYLN